MMKKVLSTLKSIKWKHYSVYLIIAVAVAILGYLSLSLDGKASRAFDTYRSLLGDMSIWIILAVSLSLVVGFLGELSLGHAGFMSVGAYLGAVITNVLIANLKIENTFVIIVVSVFVGGVSAAACGFIVGLPALRLKGDYLAIVTLAFGEIVRVIFKNANPNIFGGAGGLQLKNYFTIDRKYFFIIGFLFVILTIAVIQNTIRSKHGRAITAIRDNEIAAKATGINVTKYKLMGFVISAAFAGIAGVLMTLKDGTVLYSKFDYNYSIEILVIVVLGGMGINGSVIAAVFISLLNWKLTDMNGSLSDYKNLIYALILILLIIYRNAPALKGFREKYNFRTLWAMVFKPKHNPAKDKGDAVRWDVVPTKIEMNEVLSTDVVIDSTGDNSADIGERGGNK